MSRRSSLARDIANPTLWQAAVRDAAVQPGSYPLIAYSHSSPGHRRQATFFCSHLASHGYVVAAVDHAGNTLRDTLNAAEQETQRTAEEERQEAQAFFQRYAALRPADIRFMIDQLLDHVGEGSGGVVASVVDADRIGMTGYSFGGWTALTVTAQDHRIKATVAITPAGGRTPLPSDILRQEIDLGWARNVPTLFIGAGRDSMLPISGVCELFQRVVASKKLIILNEADHLHFCDHVEGTHEAVRKQLGAAPSSDVEAQIILQSIRPISELCPGEHAHAVLRGFGLAHMDAVLKGQEEARRLLASDLEGLMAKRGIHISVDTF